MGTLQTRLILGLLVCAAYLPPVMKSWQASKNVVQPAFVLPGRSSAMPESSPDFNAELITPEPIVSSVHVASICEAHDGRLCAAWYGGSHEGARDVAIFWSVRQPGQEGKWSKPEVMVSRSMAMQELQRPVKKIGNAVLFAGSGRQLRLLFTTVSVGGWSTSSLNLKTSRDGGESWLPAVRLTLSPFFNLSELVKNNPCPLSDGGWAVPVYHECLAKFPEILWLKEISGSELAWSKTRLFGGRFALQPALVPLGATTAMAFCRDCSSRKQIRTSRSGDLGQTWSKPQALALPNSDSGLDVLRLFDGRILLAFNDSQSRRDNLTLGLSSDEGVSWTRVAVLENEPGAEFSYPYLIQAKDGRIHLTYTWKRKSIKHASFNTGWLNTQAKSGSRENKKY